MAKEKLDVNKASINTIVGKGSVLEGNFELQDGVRVDGRLAGRLESSGILIVGPTGVVNADPIRVRDAIVAGRVEGNIEAEHQVKLDATAVVVGNVTGKVLIVEEGATLRGLCDVGETGDLPMTAMPIDLKKASGE